MIVLAVHVPEPSTSLWSSVPNVIFLCLSIVAILAGAVTVVRGQYLKVTLEGLRGDRDDLLKRLEERRIEHDDLRAKHDLTQVQLDAEIKRREALELVVTGKKELETLLSILTASDKRSERIETAVIDIRDFLIPEPPRPQRRRGVAGAS